MENKRKKTDQNVLQLSLGNKQNPLQIILNGNEKNIQLCFNPKDGKKSKTDHKQTWIPPPGKTTKKVKNCLYKNPGNEIMLQIPEDGKFVLPSGIPFTIESRHLENFRAAFYPPLIDTIPSPVADTSAGSVADLTKRIKENYEKQYAVLKESEKLLKEHETKKKVLSKYIQLLKRNMEEIGNSIQAIEKREDEDLDQESTHSMLSSRRHFGKYHRKVNGKTEQSFITSKSDKSTDDTLEDTEFCFSDYSTKDDLKCGVDTQRMPYVQPNVVNIPERKIAEKEKKQGTPKIKTRKNNNGLLQAQSSAAAETAMVRLADSMRNSKILLDNSLVQEEDIGQLQRKYIQGVETLYEDQQRLLKEIFETLETSRTNFISPEEHFSGHDCNSRTGNIISSTGFQGNDSPSDGISSSRHNNDGPSNRAPSSGSSSNGRPSHAEPNNGLSNNDPNNLTSNNGGPSHGERSNGGRSNGGPSNGRPSHGEPSNGGPNNGDPVNSVPGNGRLRNGGPISNFSENDSSGRNKSNINGGKYDDMKDFDDQYHDFEGKITGKFKLNSMPNISTFLRNQDLAEQLALANFQLEKLRKELHQANIRKAKISKPTCLCTSHDAKQTNSIKKDSGGNVILSKDTTVKTNSNIKEIIGSIVHKYNTLINKQFEEKITDTKIMQRVKTLPPVSSDRKEVRFSDEESFASLSNIQKTLQDLGKTVEKLIPATPKEFKGEGEVVFLDEIQQARQTQSASALAPGAVPITPAPLSPSRATTTVVPSASPISAASAATESSSVASATDAPRQSPPPAGLTSVAPSQLSPPKVSVTETTCVSEEPLTAALQIPLPSIKETVPKSTSPLLPPSETAEVILEERIAALPLVRTEIIDTQTPTEPQLLLPPPPPPTPSTSKEVTEVAVQFPEMDRHAGYLKNEIRHGRNLAKVTHKGSSGFEVRGGTHKLNDTYPFVQHKKISPQPERFNRVSENRKDYIVTDLEAESEIRGQSENRAVREVLYSSKTPDFKGITESTKAPKKTTIPGPSRRGHILPKEHRIHYKKRRATVGQPDISEEALFPNEMIGNQITSRENQFNTRENLAQQVDFDKLKSGFLSDISSNSEEELLNEDQAITQQRPENQWFKLDLLSDSTTDVEFDHTRNVSQDQEYTEDLVSGDVSELISERPTTRQSPRQWYRRYENNAHQSTDAYHDLNTDPNMLQDSRYLENISGNVSQFDSESQRKQSTSKQSPNRWYKLDELSGLTTDADMNQARYYDENGRSTLENTFLPSFVRQEDLKADPTTETNIPHSNRTYPKQAFSPKFTHMSPKDHETPLRKTSATQPAGNLRAKNASAKERFLLVQNQDSKNFLGNEVYRRSTYPHYPLMPSRKMDRKLYFRTTAASPKFQTRRRFNSIADPNITSRTPEMNEQLSLRRHTLPVSPIFNKEHKIRKLYNEIMS